MFKTWPAFYVSETNPDSVLLVSAGGSVINGGWTPNYNEDRSSCWCGSRTENIFRWAAEAPSDGNYSNYNKVIGTFIEARDKRPDIEAAT